MNTSALSSNLAALNQNLLQLNNSAQRIARLPEDGSVDLAAEAVNQVQLVRSSEAQINVIRAEEELTGYLFDALA